MSTLNIIFLSAWKWNRRESYCTQKKLLNSNKKRFQATLTDVWKVFRTAYTFQAYSKIFLLEFNQRKFACSRLLYGGWENRKLVCQCLAGIFRPKRTSKDSVFHEVSRIFRLICLVMWKLDLFIQICAL